MQGKRRGASCLRCAALAGALTLGAAADAAQVTASRVWPSAEYTRVTIESDAPIEFSLFSLKSPDRVVIDLEGVDPGPALDALTSRINPADPYIAQLRVARNRPGTVRLVLDVKVPINPEAFSLKPIAQYQHRLVLDLRPVEPLDPLMELVLRIEREQAEASAKGVAPGTSEAAPPSATAPDSAASSAAATQDAVTLQHPPEGPAAKPGKAQHGPAARSKKAPASSGDDVMRLVTIAVDAGHGGEDPGARGRHGTHEKEVTLAIARRLKGLLEQERNLRVVLIRDGDYFVPLAERVEKARKVHADLFVSIHADAFVKPTARGSSVFALSERGATSAAARWLARKENEADLIGGVSINHPDPTVKQVLLDLSQTATINDSLKLGRAVLRELGDVNDLHKPWVEQAGFAVLKAPDIPSILVETAFISNPQEEKKLKSAHYQHSVAAAVVSGIKRYLALNPPLARTRLALN